MITSSVGFASATAVRAAFVALASLALLAPNAASAQSQPGTIIIEGTFTFGAPPAAPAPTAPPIVTVVPVAPAPGVAVVPTYIPADAASVAMASQGDESAGAPRMRRRWGLVAAGAGIALGAYALNVVGSMLWMTMPTGITSTDLIAPTWNGHREELFYWSLVPIVGPLAQIGYAEAEWQSALFVAASALELVGFVMAIVGTASRVPVTPSGERARAPGPAVMVTPYATGSGGGLTASGTF